MMSSQQSPPEVYRISLPSGDHDGGADFAPPESVAVSGMNPDPSALITAIPLFPFRLYRMASRPPSGDQPPGPMDNSGTWISLDPDPSAFTMRNLGNSFGSPS
jgi:hypothetical protein